MRVVASVLVLLTQVAYCNAVEIKLPTEVKTQPGMFAVVKAETEGKMVRWYTPDSGLSLFPSELLSDKKTAVVVAQRAGKYRLVAYTATGDEPSEPAVCVLVVGDPPPPIPPIPPQPSDPLAKDLAAAFAADAGPDKAKHLGSLIELYKQMTDDIVNDEKLINTEHLFGVLDAISSRLMPKGVLVVMRKMIAAFVSTELGTGLVDLTPVIRKKAAATFARVRAALETINP